MKNEWEIWYIESSYSRRQRTFPPAVAGEKVGAVGKVFFLPLLRETSLNALKVRFLIQIATQKKGLFHACDEKIIYKPKYAGEVGRRRGPCM